MADTSSLPLLNPPPAPPDDSVCVRFGFARCALGLVEALKAGVLVINEDGTVAYLNEAGATILGVETDNTLGTDVLTVLAPLDRLRAITTTDGRREHRPEIEIVRKSDGVRRWIGFKMTEVADMIEPAGTRQFVLLFQDIDDAIAIRRERDRFLRMATMAQVLPTIAHEIKNPLAGIKSLADVLSEELTDPRQQEDIALIRTEIERLRMIVDGLGMADGSMMDGTVEINPCEEIRVIHRLVSPKAAAIGVTLSLEDCGSGRFPLNRSLFRVVLLNLVNNALDACTQGDSVTIRCDHGDDGTFRLIVRDTGCGMSPEVLRNASELFFTTKPQGSGIGLALISQVVQRSNGEMIVSSTEGAGTEIEIRLNLPKENR